MAWHDTWREMRGAKIRGMTTSEVVRALRADGLEASQWQLRRCLKKGVIGKPELRYGSYRFTDHHLNQLRTFFQAKQQRRADGATGSPRGGGACPSPQ